jgi:hypothetical protein
MVMFGRVPDEVTAAAHAKAAAARAHPQAPVKVRNAKALVALGEPRAIKWNGHYYHVPPVRFGSAITLYLMQEIIRSEESTRKEVQTAYARARRIMGDMVKRRFAKYLPSPFIKASDEDTLQLIQFFLYIPDDTPVPQRKGTASTVDMMGGVMDFAEAFPRHTDDHGRPYFWATYQYGIRHIERSIARESLRNADAARIASASKDDFQKWTRLMRPVAGLNG